MVKNIVVIAFVCLTLVGCGRRKRPVQYQRPPVVVQQPTTPVCVDPRTNVVVPCVVAAPQPTYRYTPRYRRTRPIYRTQPGRPRR